MPAGGTDAAHRPTSFPPGPPPRRGIVRSLRYYASMARDPIGFVRQRFDTYGDVYYAPNTDGGLFVFRHPDHLREVLATKASSFTKEHSAFAQLASVVGDGLLTSDGATWTRHRRMVGPAFAPARIAEYGAIMVEEALATADRWQRGGVRPVSTDMTRLTLRIVSRALFGHDVAERDIRTIARAMTTFQRMLTIPDVLPRWLPTPARARAAELDRLMRRLIEARRGARTSDRTDLLEMLVTAVDTEDPNGRNARLTIDEVRDQLVTLFLAGHETTSHALTFTWHCLARNADVERKLHAEVDAVLGGRLPSPSDLDRLPYTEQVLSEALRLYPPAFGIARRAREDVEIGGWTLPRGSEVMLWVYLTHHDPRFFPEPEAFRPERFAPDEAQAIPRFAYLPFGGGPRACIGKSFAMTEARLILATLAQRFRVRLAPGRPPLEVAPRITLTPKRTLRMLVCQR